ncbi:MAG: class I SAM-dependent methyltransferase [Sumerlaeia bacterium]
MTDPAAVPSPTLDLATLPHDTARRFGAIVAIARRLLLPEGAAVLDVGGYPGMLGRVLRGYFPDWRVATVDTHQAELPDYHIGDGSALPFDNASFDFVVTSDTLEHIPPGKRPAFINELCRVARGPVMIGAPFHHPVIERIEETLDETHRRLTGKPHPWLWEHRENGLPKLETVVGLFPTDRSQAVFRNAPIFDWTAWQWAQLARETTDLLEDGWLAFDRALAEMDARMCAADKGVATSADLERVGGHGDAQGERGFFPYRHIIVSQPESSNAPLAPQPGGDFWHPRGLDEGYQCLAYSEFMAELVGNLGRGGEDSPLTAALDMQARRALSGAEGEIRRLKGERAAARSLIGRLWDKIGDRLP